MKLSVVVPAFNEEKRLPSALKSYAQRLFREFGTDIELIVVANHCADRTADVAREVGRDFPFIQVIEEPKKVGKGGAVELGMRMATGDLVGFVDADGATSPDSFVRLVGGIGDSGCVIGSRWIEGAVVSPKQSWVRRLASRMLNKLIVQGVFGLQVYDSQCGAKVFKGSVLREVLPVAVEPGWAFDIELLCRVKRLGYSIRELPIEWSHVSGNPTTFVLMSMQMLASVWRVKKALARS